MGTFGDGRAALGLRVVIGTAITATVVGLAASLLQEPFVFPSLGPTMFLMFFAPLAVMSAPRNVIVGHGLGIMSGFAALLVFGLASVPADLFDLSLARVGAIVVALSLTFALMIWGGFPHPPAGATALIVALGILRTPLDLAIMMLAVLLVSVCAFTINRLAGIEVPRWSGPQDPSPAVNE